MLVYKERRMVAGYLLYTLNFEVALLTKMLAVPGAKRNFRI